MIGARQGLRAAAMALDCRKSGYQLLESVIVNIVLSNVVDPLEILITLALRCFSASLIWAVAESGFFGATQIKLDDR